MLELGHTRESREEAFSLYDGGRFVLCGMQVLFGFVISGTLRLGIIR